MKELDETETDAHDVSHQPVTLHKVTDEHAERTGARASWIVITAIAILAMLASAAAGYFKYESLRVTQVSRATVESVKAASDGAVAMLSYTPANAHETLTAATSLLTGAFRNTYSQLVNDVVVPGAQQKHISSTATVAAAASVSATTDHASVLVFVNQTLVVADDAPTQTTSVIEVTLDDVDDHWLISGFDPK